MSNSKYLCHLCKKMQAYKSQAYPELIVCRCSGQILEVGKLVKGVFFSNQQFTLEELKIMTALNRAHTDDSWNEDLLRRAMDKKM